jgi:recombination protein RecT
MNDEQQERRPANAIVAFKQGLSRLVEAKELALPSNVSPEAFKNAAIVAVQDNPKILTCDQSSVFKSIRKLAAAGLVPDGREAALVPFKTKIDGNYVDVCQAMPMVFGLVKMARRSGEIADIRAHIVYQAEVDQGKFSYVIGDTEALTHEPILFGEKGAPVGCYAIAVLKDGSIIREWMDAAQIDVVRRAGASQKIFERGAPPKVSDVPLGIWKDWWDQMWKKTVIRRLCKRLDLSSEDMRRMLADEDEMALARDVTPAERPLTPFQTKVAAARGTLPPTEPAREEAAPEEPAPADVVDAEIVDPDKPKFIDLDPKGSFPGSSEWDLGGKAAAEKVSIEACPFPYGSDQARDWCGGWWDETDRKAGA